MTVLPVAEPTTTDLLVSAELPDLFTGRRNEIVSESDRGLPLVDGAAGAAPAASVSMPPVAAEGAVAGRGAAASPATVRRGTLGPEALEERPAGRPEPVSADPGFAPAVGAGGEAEGVGADDPEDEETKGRVGLGRSGEASGSVTDLVPSVRPDGPLSAPL